MSHTHITHKGPHFITKTNEELRLRGQNIEKVPALPLVHSISPCTVRMSPKGKLDSHREETEPSFFYTVILNQPFNLDEGLV